MGFPVSSAFPNIKENRLDLHLRSALVTEIQCGNYVLYPDVPKEEQSSALLVSLQSTLKLHLEFQMSKRGWSSPSPHAVEDAKP